MRISTIIFHKKHSSILAVCLLLLFSIYGEASAKTQWPHVAISKDGTPISYEVFGTGEPTLVFVHGWSCDSRYWRAQVPVFSKKHRVVVLDLAGHGHSGMARTTYSMKAFGEDVKAVTNAMGSSKVILVGHSMGGSVIAEAARLMPDRVLALIGIDTLENIEYPLTREQFEEMTAPLKKDFATGVRQFAATMMKSDSGPDLREWILADMAAAPPKVALSAMTELLNQYITKEAADIFKEVRIPVVTVNADMWPVNFEANRKHMLSYDAIILKDTDHFLMMNRPDDFNKALEKAIQMVTAR